MIRFSLKCKKGHEFDSWFGSNADFERLQARGLELAKSLYDEIAENGGEDRGTQVLYTRYR